MTETKTTKKISDSYANACIVHDIQNYDNGNVEVREGFRAAIKCSRTRAYTYLDPSRVEVDKSGNIRKVDGKRVHKFPWCSFFTLEGSPSFEKYKNGITDEISEKYYTPLTREFMEEESPGCTYQSDEEKQEVVDYWKNNA